MKKVFIVGNKDIYDIDTTILFTSEFNYLNDAISFLNNNCVVITNQNKANIKDIPPSIFIHFECEYLINKENLTIIDEIKINILSNLNSPKKFFVFLDVLSYTDSAFKKKVITYLKEHSKIILNYTSDIEETLLLDYLIIIHNNKVIMEGSTASVLQEEKIIKKLGFNLPFIVELSLGLKYYGLVDKIYFNNESLVVDLWK